MGEIKVSGLPDRDIARLKSEAEQVGLPLENYVRLKLSAASDRGATARAIRSRQPHIAHRDSTELIREERDAR